MLFFKLNKKEKAVHTIHTLQYGVRIALSAYACWLIFHDIFGLDPVWAIFTVVIVTEPDIESTFDQFKSRIVNTFVGCIVGLIYVYTFQIAAIGIPISMLFATIISGTVFNLNGNWKLSPATAGMVVAKEILDPAHGVALHIAIYRTIEILGGSLISILIAWIFIKLLFYRRFWRRRNLKLAKIKSALSAGE